MNSDTCQFYHLVAGDLFMNTYSNIFTIYILCQYSKWIMTKKLHRTEFELFKHSNYLKLYCLIDRLT